MSDGDKKMTKEENARLFYESGIVKYRNPEATKEERREAIELLVKACDLGNADAEYLIGAMVLSGKITLKNSNPEEHALHLLRSSAFSGNMNARCLLNSYCENRDEKREIKVSPYGTEGPLKDFDGELIKINKLF